jgi:hypothetical protein
LNSHTAITVVGGGRRDLQALPLVPQAVFFFLLLEFTLGLVAIRRVPFFPASGILKPNRRACCQLLRAKWMRSQAATIARSLSS